MARRKNMKVDEGFHRESGIRFEVQLTPDNEFVTTEIMGRVFQGKVASEVYHQAIKYLEDNYRLNFQPVIAMRKVKPFQEQYWEQRSYVGLEVWRFYWAVNPQGTMFKLDWNMGGNPNYAKEFWLGNSWNGGTFAPPVSVGDTTYIPYDEDIWLGALELIRAIELARQRADQLMSEPDVSAAVLKRAGQMGGSFLLSNGGDNE